MKQRNHITYAIALVSLSLASGCSREVTVKIGVVAPMSGDLAQYGKDMAHGAEVAMDELHAEGFRIGNKRAHFELIAEDDKGNADEGKLAAKRLIDAGVVGVFGHFNSGVSIAAAPLYAAAGIPQMSVSTNPKYTRLNLKTTFRITADDIQQGTALGVLLNEKLKAKSIFMVDDRTTFGIGLAEEVGKLLKTRGVEPPHESVDPKTADYAQLAQKIKTANADAVFFGGDEGVGLPLLKAMREAGSTAQFVAGDAMCDVSFLAKAKGLADQNFFCTIAGVPPSWLADGIGFTQQYKAKFKTDTTPGSYASLAYTGVHVFAQAMQEAKSTDPVVYLPVLAKGSFDGKIQGAVEFDAKGDVKDGTVVIYEVIKGKLTERKGLL
jgi:branched-chain amino acid transport system substrate-binding protein